MSPVRKGDETYGEVIGKTAEEIAQVFVRSARQAGLPDAGPEARGQRQGSSETATQPGYSEQERVQPDSGEGQQEAGKGAQEDEFSFSFPSEAPLTRPFWGWCGPALARGR